MERSFNFRDIHMQNESAKIDIVWDRPKVSLQQAHSKAVKQWFEVAKVNHRPSWVRLVKRVGGGGL